MSDTATVLGGGDPLEEAFDELDQADEETGGEQTATEVDGAVDPYELADQHGQARPGFGRAKFWRDRTPEEVDALRAIGIVQVDVPAAAPESAPTRIRPGDPEFVTTMATASATAKAGWRAAQAGSLDLSPDTFERLGELMRAAETMPEDHPTYYAGLQEAASIIDAAEAERVAAQPFGRVKRRDSGGQLPDGSWYDIETNFKGETRTVVYSPDDIAAAEAELQEIERPDVWGDPTTVTAEQAAQWTGPQWAEFEKAHPQHADRLAGEASLAMEQASMRRRGLID